MDSNLDPRAVLAHLNRLGYRNISPEQLKEFIRGKRISHTFMDE